MAEETTLTAMSFNAWRDSEPTLLAIMTALADRQKIEETKLAAAAV